MAGDSESARREPRSFAPLCAAVSILTAGLLCYSQLASFTWDEGYHLLAAQLIKAGKRPYLDFLFPQTPLNAYWNAGLMRVAGESWRVAHAFAALFTGGAVLLAADYLRRRLPVPGWRLPAALAAASLFALNAAVVGYATLGQAYGICLFLLAAAFRFSVLTVERRGLLLAGLAGLCAGAAANCSLLTAAAVPVFAAWVTAQDRAGRRWKKLAAFLAGSVAASIPLLWLFAHGPRQTLFSVLEYQLLHRDVYWPDATRHNLEVLTSWVDSPDALLLGLLATAGLLFIVFRSGWDSRLRAEFSLCGWLAVALGVHISTAHPTFSRYYLLLTPFLSVLAGVGLCWVGSRLLGPERQLPPVLVLTALLALGLARWISDGREFSWREYEELARKVAQVTPPDGRIIADEQVYFLARRVPPSGMELEDSHKLDLPAPLAESLHVAPRTALRRRVQAGEFSTVQTCDDAWADQLGLRRAFRQTAAFGDCIVYWEASPEPPRE